MTSSIAHSEADITFLYNVRINSKVRMNRLLSNINQVSSLEAFPISLRVRGVFAEDVAQAVNVEKVLLYNTKSDVSWKLNLLEQVLNSSSEYFVLMQEDHSLVCDGNTLINALVEFKNLNLDFMPLSFLPQYNPLVNLLSANELFFTHSENLKYIHIDRKVTKKLKKNDNYFINLVGIFRRELLIKVLLSARPFIKYFAADTPFDMEQRPSQKWFLPINWALPTHEIFGCIDDDHGVVGYSLISRGLHVNDAERVIDHHNTDELGKFQSLITRFNSAKLLKFFRICKYTSVGLLEILIHKKHLSLLARDVYASTKSNGLE
jgi:hypothetical protein